jgi:hypothetical protein
MSAADAHQPSETASRSGVARMIVALWLSVCALSLLLIALTIAFHLVTRYDWYFADSFQPWRVQTVQALGVLGAPILGALIVWRQPTNRDGWVWCLLGLAASVAPPSPTSSGPGTSRRISRAATRRPGSEP